MFSGIEGGATKTVCVVGSEEGMLIGVGYGGPSNYLTAGIETTRKSLTEAVDSALTASGLHRPIETTYAGLAGVGLLPLPQIIEDTVKEAIGSSEVFINSDGYVALYGAYAGRLGMILVSGTGSVAMGLDESKGFARVGGWGHILGDEGSGFHLGLEGLRVVARAHDGLSPPTLLTRRALDFLQMEQIEELVRVFYLEGIGKERLAMFSTEVIEAAAKSDQVAIDIVNEECKSLKRMVEVLKGRLRLSNPRLVLSGGLFENSEWFRRRFIEELGDEVEIVEPLFRPVTGAFMLALTSSSVQLTSDVIQNIQSSERSLLRG